MRTDYTRLTRKKLEALAIERYGSLQAASLIAESFCKIDESIIKNKAHWVRALEKPMDVQDLGRIAAHENWAKGVRGESK